MGLAERIREAMGARSAADLARAAQVSPAAVTQWLDGKTKTLKSDKAALLEIATGYRATWLATGKGPKMAGNVEQTGSKPVPVISWVQAGNWSQVHDPFQPGQADEWLPCPVRHGPRTYALIVRGPSMYNPRGDLSFKDGDRIFVDPDREPVNRSLVIVRLDDEQEATFKQLLIEGDRRYLQALNPDWPRRIIEINGNATLGGVVIGRVESFV